MRRRSSTNQSGRYTVPRPGAAARIMQLRTDPAPPRRWRGRSPTQRRASPSGLAGRDQGDLYIAHFLGAGGATRLINAKSNPPALRATDLFPAASRPIPRSSMSGASRVRQQVYDVLVAGHGAGKTDPVPIPGQHNVGPIAAACPPMPRGERDAVRSARCRQVRTETPAFQACFTPAARPGVRLRHRTLECQERAVPGRRVKAVPRRSVSRRISLAP